MPKYGVQSENDIVLWKAGLICYTLRLIRIEFDQLKYAVRTILIFPPKFKILRLDLFSAELRHFLPDNDNKIQVFADNQSKPEVIPEVSNNQHNDDVITSRV